MNLHPAVIVIPLITVGIAGIIGSPSNLDYVIERAPQRWEELGYRVLVRWGDHLEAYGPTAREALKP